MRGQDRYHRYIHTIYIHIGIQTCIYICICIYIHIYIYIQIDRYASRHWRYANERSVVPFTLALHSDDHATRRRWIRYCWVRLRVNPVDIIAPWVNPAVSIDLRSKTCSQTVYNTKGTQAHTHRELIRTCSQITAHTIRTLEQTISEPASARRVIITVKSECEREDASFISVAPTYIYIYI